MSVTDIAALFEPYFKDTPAREREKVLEHMSAKLFPFLPQAGPSEFTESFFTSIKKNEHSVMARNKVDKFKAEVQPWMLCCNKERVYPWKEFHDS